MRQRLETLLDEMEAAPPPVPAEEYEQTRDFLKWLLDDHFTFLGYREFEVEYGDGRGIFRSNRYSGSFTCE